MDGAVVGASDGDILGLAKGEGFKLGAMEGDDGERELDVDIDGALDGVREKALK